MSVDAHTQFSEGCFSWSAIWSKAGTASPQSFAYESEIQPADLSELNIFRSPSLQSHMLSPPSFPKKKGVLLYAPRGEINEHPSLEIWPNICDISMKIVD